MHFGVGQPSANNAMERVAAKLRFAGFAASAPPDDGCQQ